ncbi:hypothetical protein [Halobellus ordinarius]|uniref:hypothetical protein n=1 Tax=Halobellus ordinarius TaxID=3075120 RepID=UPI0028807313|nr:hypothetical protein [Halobellus sp. ZY16]
MTDNTSDRGRSDDHRQAPADSPSESSPDGDDSRLPSRRQYLGLVAAATSALGGCGGGGGGTSVSTTPGASTADGTRTSGDNEISEHGIEFDRVLDAVDDLGLDSTGVSPVNDRLEEALTEGTLVRFPEGEYLFDESVALTAPRIGVLGEEEVTFRPADGFNGLLFDGVTEGLDRVLIENVDIDIRAADTTAGIRLACARQFHVQDVEFLGRGLTHNSGQVSAFLLSIREEGGRGVLRNAVAKKGSRIDGYAGGNGRIGIWVGWANKGTVRIENCDFREFGNNGTYTSRTPGQVEVVNSYFLNNNASNVRIGGEGSYVENCTVEIDMEKYTGPLSENPKSLNTRGIVVEQGVQLKGAEPIPAGAEIRDCTVLARSSPLSQAAIEQSPQARSLLIRDTDIQCDIDGTPAVRRGPPGTLQYRPERRRPPPPLWTRLRNVTIDGSAAGRAAIDLHGAPGSVIEDCTVHAPGRDRDGILLTDSPRSSIRGGEIRASGYPVVIEIDPETPPDRRLLCLDTGSMLRQFIDTTEADDLTDSPPLLQVLRRNETGGTVCLGLAADIDAQLQSDALSEPILIGIVGHESGVPLGLLLDED